MSAQDEDRLVTVCDSCLTAACWLGVFYCQHYIEAGVVELPVKRLRELNREHEQYWTDDYWYPGKVTK